MCTLVDPKGPLKYTSAEFSNRRYKIKVSENLGATAVALVAPVDTSLHAKWKQSGEICKFSSMY